MLNNMTVYENVALALYAVEQGGKGMKRKIMRALGLVGIAEKHMLIRRNSLVGNRHGCCLREQWR